MHTVRAAELQQWVASGEYERIMRGRVYAPRESETTERPLGDHWQRRQGATTPGEAKRSGPPGGRGDPQRERNGPREAFRNAQKRGSSA